MGVLQKIPHKVVGMEGMMRLEGSFAGYRLKKPIQLNISFDGGIWCVENEELELYGCGMSLAGAVEELKVVFKTLIEEYLLESDENLSEKAIELKRKLAEYVEVSV